MVREYLALRTNAAWYAFYRRRGYITQIGPSVPTRLLTVLYTRTRAHAHTCAEERAHAQTRAQERPGALWRAQVCQAIAPVGHRHEVTVGATCTEVTIWYMLLGVLQGWEY